MIIHPRAPALITPKFNPFYEGFTDILGVMDARTSATRASSGWYFNSSGVHTEATTDQPRTHARLDHNPSTLAARGFLIEEQRVNRVANPRMEGASAPSTIPTGWISGLITAGIAAAYAKTTVAGIDYLDVTLSGTTSGSYLGTLYFHTTSSGQAATSPGERWTLSANAALIAGSFPVGTCDLTIRETDGSNAFLRQTLIDLESASGTVSRFSGSATMGASTASVTTGLRITAGAGVAVSYTIRIGIPQLELAAFASSPILPPVSSPAASTRAREIARIMSLSGMNFSATKGSMLAEFAVGALGSSDSRVVFSISDGTANNRILLRVDDNGSDQIQMIVIVGGVQVATVTGPAAVANTFYKAGISWNNNSFRLAVNGTGYTEDTSGAVPTVDRIGIGYEAESDTSYLNGWLKQLAYIPEQMSQTYLNTWSA
jgi:hypothetical protein